MCFFDDNKDSNSWIWIIAIIVLILILCDSNIFGRNDCCRGGLFDDRDDCSDRKNDCC